MTTAASRALLVVVDVDALDAALLRAVPFRASLLLLPSPAAPAAAPSSSPELSADAAALLEQRDVTRVRRGDRPDRALAQWAAAAPPLADVVWLPSVPRADEEDDAALFFYSAARSVVDAAPHAVLHAAADEDVLAAWRALVPVARFVTWARVEAVAWRGRLAVGASRAMYPRMQLCEDEGSMAPVATGKRLAPATTLLVWRHVPPSGICWPRFAGAARWTLTAIAGTDKDDATQLLLKTLAVELELRGGGLFLLRSDDAPSLPTVYALGSDDMGRLVVYEATPAHHLLLADAVASSAERILSLDQTDLDECRVIDDAQLVEGARALTAAAPRELVPARTGTSTADLLLKQTDKDRREIRRTRLVQSRLATRQASQGTVQFPPPTSLAAFRAAVEADLKVLKDRVATAEHRTRPDRKYDWCRPTDMHAVADLDFPPTYEERVVGIRNGTVQADELDAKDMRVHGVTLYLPSRAEAEQAVVQLAKVLTERERRMSFFRAVTGVNAGAPRGTGEAAASTMPVDAGSAGRGRRASREAKVDRAQQMLASQANQVRLAARTASRATQRGAKPDAKEHNKNVLKRAVVDAVRGILPNKHARFKEAFNNVYQTTKTALKPANGFQSLLDPEKALTTARMLCELFKANNMSQDEVLRAQADLREAAGRKRRRSTSTGTTSAALAASASAASAIAKRARGKRGRKLLGSSSP